jgi:thioredoxin-like negative regulator of GroEL
MKERKRTLPVVVVNRETAFKAYGIDGIPQVVVVDRDGTVVKHWVGLRRENELREVIQPLLTR